jgi:hypothetical protein
MINNKNKIKAPFLISTLFSFALSLFIFSGQASYQLIEPVSDTASIVLKKIPSFHYKKLMDTDSQAFIDLSSRKELDKKKSSRLSSKKRPQKKNVDVEQEIPAPNRNKIPFEKLLPEDTKKIEVIKRAKNAGVNFAQFEEWLYKNDNSLHQLLVLENYLPNKGLYHTTRLKFADFLINTAAPVLAHGYWMTSSLAYTILEKVGIEFLYRIPSYFILKKLKENDKFSKRKTWESREIPGEEEARQPSILQRIYNWGATKANTAYRWVHETLWGSNKEHLLEQIWNESRNANAFIKNLKNSQASWIYWRLNENGYVKDQDIKGLWSSKGWHLFKKTYQFVLKPFISVLVGEKITKPYWTNGLKKYVLGEKATEKALDATVSLTSQITQTPESLQTDIIGRSTRKLAKSVGTHISEESLGSVTQEFLDMSSSPSSFKIDSSLKPSFGKETIKGVSRRLLWVENTGESEDLDKLTEQFSSLTLNDDVPQSFTSSPLGLEKGVPVGLEKSSGSKTSSFLSRWAQTATTSLLSAIAQTKLATLATIAKNHVVPAVNAHIARFATFVVTLAFTATYVLSNK